MVTCKYTAPQDTEQGGSAKAEAPPAGVAEKAIMAAAPGYNTYIFEHVYMCKYIVNNDSGPFLGDACPGTAGAGVAQATANPKGQNGPAMSRHETAPTTRTRHGLGESVLDDSRLVLRLDGRGRH